MFGNHAPVQRTLFWRYKAHNQRAVRSADWKYLKIDGNEFLFNVVTDQRERANLAQKYPQVFARMKQQWETWNAAMLQSTQEVYSQDIDAKVQADHYHANIPD